MDIEFAGKKLKKACISEQAMKARWGPKMAKKLKRRLADLEAATTLEEVRKLPGRCHELSEDRKGQLAMDLVHPVRLLFRPNHDPVPAKPDGGLDWQQVTSIEVLEVCDYH